jgi:hypothetical protein
MPHAIDLSRVTSVETLERDWRDYFKFVSKVDKQFSVYYTGNDARPTFYLIDVCANKVAVECPLSRKRRAGMNVYHPDFTKCHMRYRGRGLAIKLYTAMLKWGVVMMAGTCQSEGSQKLWAKLCNQRGIEVWGFNKGQWEECFACEAMDRPDTADFDPYETNCTMLAMAA